MLYDLGLLIFSVFYIPALLFKGKLHKGFLERFGIYGREKSRILGAGKDRIWIQAVSVGEVALLRNLIPQLKKEFPSSEIVLSTITKTGGDLAVKFFSRDAIVIYFPVDFGFITDKVVGLIKPKCYIMVETEIWPNLIKALRERSIPSILINGRISDRSYGRYRFVKPFLKSTLGDVNLFCMQSKTDKERILDLGAPEDKVRVTGNIKFDIGPSLKARSSADTRELLGLKPEEKLFVAGSTHAGEDEVVTGVFSDLVKEFPALRLLIAPRHLDRVPAIERMIKTAEFVPVRVSNLHGLLPDEAQRAKAGRTTDECGAKRSLPEGDGRRILILDTIGQLNDIYAIAEIVFIGGSLVKHGGHNPIEPAVFGHAVLFGPHMFNFKDISRAFLSGLAAIQVSGREDLAANIKRLLKNENEMANLNANAKNVIAENRGATSRDLDAIREILR